MLTGLGLGAYYAVFSLAMLDAVFLLRREIGEPLLRIFGWTVSLIAVTALVAMALPSLSLGPVIGPGGYLGATGRGMLESHFATAGAYILTISLLLGGLLLCTDYVLVRFSMWLIGTPAKGLFRAGKVAAHRKSATRRKSKQAEEADEGEWEYEDEYEDEAEEEEDEVPIKIGGRPAAAEEDEEEPEEEAEVDEEEEFDEEEADQTPAATKKKDKKRKKKKHRLAAALKIRPPVRKKSDRDEIIEKLDAATLPGDTDDYVLPPVEMLRDSDDFPFDDHERQVRRTAKILEQTFENFGFNIKVVEIQTGPVIAQYEIELERGLRLAKITNLGDDIAIALRVPSVRIVAPIPGKNTVGIEVPNEKRQMVRIREIIEEAGDEVAKMKIPIFLGKDVSGNPMVIDLATLPHLLIAGRTGTGKSVCLNSLIISMLMTRRPDEVRMLMIDPKMVELSPYQRLPHLMHPVVTDMGKAAAILEWAVAKMEERYALLARAGVRHVSVYNQLGEEELRDRLQPESEEEWNGIPRYLPYIVIVADEIADLMMTVGKEVEQHIIRLAQKSRAIGIHLILATQKPTVDVITGLIKSNLPARISFQVASRTDSRVVLDEMGAEKLLGNGDMLFLWPGTSTLHRGQGTYVSDDEINDVIGVVGTNKPQFVEELVQLQPKDQEEGDGGGIGQLKKRDELYEGAVDVIVREGRGSVSLLQRSLGVGYGRAARLIDFMAEDGIVGPYNGSQAREVLISVEQWAQMMGDAEPEPATPAPISKPKPKALSAPSASKKSGVVKIDDDAPWEDDEEEEEEAIDETEEELVDEEDENEYEEEEIEDEAADEEYEEGRI